MGLLELPDTAETRDQTNPFVQAKSNVQALGLTPSSNLAGPSQGIKSLPEEGSLSSADCEPLHVSPAWVAPSMISPAVASPSHLGPVPESPSQTNPFSIIRSMSSPIGGFAASQVPMAPVRSISRNASFKTDVALRSSHTLQMMKTVSTTPTMPLLPEDAEKSSLEPMMRSVVKVFCIHTEPNFSLPWQRKRQYNSFSSGFVVSIQKRWLLTNAHSVHYHTQVKVKKHGDDTKYIAKVLAVGAECDIALLTVESEDFWQEVPAVEFGSLPRLQDSVAVVGYPVGGDTVSVTVGVVSRLEVKNYSFGSTSLLTVQIDAAINSGNSGGPVFGQDNKCVGIAFESLVGTGIDGVGYIVPVAVVAHFLEDYTRNGHFTGFPDLGVRWQELESCVLRKAHKLEKHQKGVLVRALNPTAPAHKLLRVNDVIVRFDGVQVSNDGTVPFRETERVCFEWLPAIKFVGDEATLDVLRGGKIMSVTIPLTVPPNLIPTHIENQDPTFFVVAGLVFTASCIPYLIAEYRTMVNVPYQLEADLYDFPESEGHQVVVLSQVLACDATLGYEDFANLKVLNFNGIPPHNMAHLVELVVECTDSYMWFELDNHAVIVIDTAQVPVETHLVLQQHSIPTGISSDVQAALPGVVWPPRAGAKHEGQDSSVASNGSVNHADLGGVKGGAGVVSVQEEDAVTMADQEPKGGDLSAFGSGAM